MTQGFYIVFVCDGSVLTSWHYPVSMDFEVNNLPLVKTPIWLSTDILYSISINNVDLLSETIIEGEIINPQPEIKITDMNTGLGISGAPVFAVLLGYEDQGVENYFPQKYEYQQVGTYNKQLIKPIAAEYHQNYTDPFAEWLFKPKLTDSNGLVQFEGLTFTTKGNLGITGCIFC